MEAIAWITDLWLALAEDPAWILVIALAGWLLITAADALGGYLDRKGCSRRTSLSFVFRPSGF